MRGPNYTGFRALLAVTGHGERFTRSIRAMNDYDTRGRRTRRRSTTTRARSATSSRPRQLGPQRTNAIDLKVLVKPLINLIWAAGFLFVVGRAVAMWPDAVEQRRLAARYAAGAAPAGI